MARKKPTSPQEIGFYEAYAGFARNVRTWFIAYGIGAPVLFVTNQEVWKRISGSGDGPAIAYLFLAGVAVQIVEAIIYKTAMWYLYMSELEQHEEEEHKDWRYRSSDWISGSYALEMLFDVVTLALFGVATAKVLQLFT